MFKKIVFVTLCLVALGLSAQSALAIQWGVDISLARDAWYDDIYMAEFRFFDDDLNPLGGWVAMAKGPDSFWQFNCGIPQNAEFWGVRLIMIEGWVNGDNPAYQSVDDREHMQMTIDYVEP